ncbi:MAG: hypothetical protein U9Q22_00490, partial [Candidatus Altiarchaeota archaeon]|nr:hypothetical protein [Candidatus Altiarchaeota archaeon]
MKLYWVRYFLLCIAACLCFSNSVSAPSTSCTEAGGHCHWLPCQYGEKNIGKYDCFSDWVCCKEDPIVKTCNEMGGHCHWLPCQYGEKNIGKYDCFSDWVCCSSGQITTTTLGATTTTTIGDCEDSDEYLGSPGYLMVKGVCVDASGSYTDECALDGLSLIEKLCLSKYNECGSLTVDCKNLGFDKCENGMC